MSERKRQSKAAAALTAARLYYLQDKTMDVIAEELGTSRSSVSRLLSYAREVGLVDIRINSPLEHAGELEQQLHDRLQVTAHVVPMPESVTEVERLERVAVPRVELQDRVVRSDRVVELAEVLRVAV